MMREAPSGEAELGPLVEELRQLILAARRAAAGAVNTVQVATGFELGRRIVEHEQHGARRATYGAQLLSQLSERLTAEFGRGFSSTNLKLMRQFYLEHHARIRQSPTDQSALPPIGQSPTDQFNGPLAHGSVSTSMGSPAALGLWRALFPLSWTHYVHLLSVKDPAERRFYEIEAAEAQWSVAELKRQTASCLYERLALSRDKQGIRALAERGQTLEQAADLLKEPLILEFLGLQERPGYSETQLETALIDHLEKFLLELGKGFLFEARQKRFTFDDDHFFVDLVFYNRLLRCYVLIDLKLAKLTHQDLGQMQMYVNYFDRHVRLPGENPTVGLLLCKAKKNAMVELTLPPDANVHAREYQLYLPSKELLRTKLLEWTSERDASTE